MDAGQQHSPVPVKPAGAPGEEKRQVHRRRTLKAARVILSDWSTMDCMIRDMSTGGAHLRFGATVVLPASFRLHMLAEGTMVPVNLLWQRGLSAGVALAGPEVPASRGA